MRLEPGRMPRLLACQHDGCRASPGMGNSEAVALRIWTPMATWTLWWVTKGPTKFGGSNKNTVVSTWDLGGIFPLRQLTLDQ